MCDLLRVTGPIFQRANSRIRFGNKPLSQNETVNRSETNLISAWSGVAWECPEGRTTSRKGILQIHTGTSTANSDFLRFPTPMQLGSWVLMSIIPDQGWAGARYWGPWSTTRWRMRTPKSMPIERRSTLPAPRHDRRESTPRDSYRSNRAPGKGRKYGPVEPPAAPLRAIAEEPESLPGSMSRSASDASWDWGVGHRHGPATVDCLEERSLPVANRRGKPLQNNSR